MKEFIISFLPEQFANPEIFRVELAGITYPFASYCVNREHSHIYSLEYIISGSGEIKIDGNRYFPSQGDVYMLPKGHHHHYWSNKKDPMHKLWINVSGSLCDHLFQVYRLQHSYLFKAADLQSIFRALLEVCKAPSLSNHERSQQSSLLFHQLLEQLFQLSQANSSTVLMPDSVAQAKAYLDNRLDQQVTVAELASLVNLSSSQFTRQFKSALNQTPYDYFLSK